MEFFIYRLREELKIDEGCKYEIYLDHLGLPTAGIGHLLTGKDDEYDKPIGTVVSEERVTEWFDQDIQMTMSDCKKVYDDWDALPEEVKLIMANMMFNLGYPRFCKFKKMIQAVKDGNWIEAGNQMTFDVESPNEICIREQKELNE